MPREPAPTHFGQTLRKSMFGHRMTRDLYAYPNRSPHQKYYREDVGEDTWNHTAWAYRDEEHTEHSDTYLLVQRDRALVNFDLSMQYFESLDATEFEQALQHVLDKGRTFKPVEALQDWDEVPGAYIMVFDDYKQFYIGESENIRKRIRQHWSARKGFDRLLWGSPYESIFPVDELRALDNTRIFAARRRNPYAVEERTERAADQRFCLNRIEGGGMNPLRFMLTGSQPRARSHEAQAIPMSHEDWESALKEIADLVAQPGPAPRHDVVEQLAGLDMTIYSIPQPPGGPFLWTRRDSIGRAAARGELSGKEYEGFLSAIGEHVVWPD